MTMYVMRHPFNSFSRSYDPFEAVSDLLDLDVPSVQYVPYHPRGPARTRQPLYGMRAARSPVYVATRPTMPWEMHMPYVRPASTSVYPSTVLSYLLEEQRRREELEEAQRRAQLASYLQLLEAAAAVHPHQQTDTSSKQKTKPKTQSQRRQRREQPQRIADQAGGSAASSDAASASPAPSTPTETAPDTQGDASASAVATTAPSVRRDPCDWALSQDGAAYELRLPLATGASVSNVAMQVLRHADGRRSLEVSVDAEQRQQVRLAGGWPMVSVRRETTSRTVSLPEDASLEGVSVTTATSELVIRAPRSGSGEAASCAAAPSEPTESATVASLAHPAADGELVGRAPASAETTTAAVDDAQPVADDASQVSSEVTVEDVDDDDDEANEASSERS